VFNGSLSDIRWGQSFVATGVGLASVDLFAASSPNYSLTWSVREGGPTGALVGPTKTVQSAYFASSTGLAGVSFNPGEVPLVPGQTYYVEAYTPANFTPYLQEPSNAYPDGHAFRNGTAVPASDLSMTILEYATAITPPTPREVIAFTNFNEPALGSTSYSPGAGAAELGFQTTTLPSGGANPLVGVLASGSSPTSPIFSHRSVDAVTTFDTVDLSGHDDVTVSLIARVRNTGYESSDRLRISVTNGSQEVVLLNANNTLLNALAALDYQTYTAAIPEHWTQATLVLSSFSNSSADAERYDFDSIVFLGAPSPDTSLLGDVNDDGRVDRTDLALLAASYGMTGGAGRGDGDFDGNGRVDLLDLATLKTHFGVVRDAPPAVGVAEPASGALAVLAGGWLWYGPWLRRRADEPSGRDGRRPRDAERPPRKESPPTPG
jgi:hypothetical protein